MKNEERILELLAETLQRIDRHSEQIERHSEQFDRHSELIQLIVNKLQENDKRLDKHEDALVGLKERTETMHQSSLEQQQTYRAMTELLMHHNRILSAKGIL
ncbi:hypothetical protein [Spirosoma validum]|uniref:Uncharacterized protein n=1 Tax=Spirosoma validum TaxID=2771355 RepID=A0A927AX15_9BACT|nr:hypothetical protein [Spirosoma validum]MBD2751351.1 hypothetical protein [Spirosoma validum]